MPEGYVLSEEDRAMLQEWHRFKNQQLVSRQNRGTIPSVGDDSDNLIARVPSGVLPALDSVNAVPGMRACEIYKSDPCVEDGAPPTLEKALNPDGSPWLLEVYNYQSAAIPTGLYFGIRKTKFGMWVADSMGGGGGSDVVLGTFDQSIDSSTTGPYTGTVVESNNGDLVNTQVTLNNYVNRQGPAGTRFIGLAYRRHQITGTAGVEYLIIASKCQEVPGNGGP